MPAPTRPAAPHRTVPAAVGAALILAVAAAGATAPVPGGHGSAPGAVGAAAAPTLADCNAPREGGHARHLHAPAAGVATLPARAVWLDAQRLRWPGAEPGARTRLVHSARGQLGVVPGQAVMGADAGLLLQAAAAPLPADAGARWNWVGAGPEWTLAEADRARLPALLQGQLLLVQEDDAGRVQRATRVQHPGALDALYAAAESIPDLGATPTRRATTFRLWAPTAQRVALCLHAPARPGTDSATVPAAALHPLLRDARTGTWSLRLPRDLSHHTYTYLVDVVPAEGGLVRNRVTDPYALSLTADSQRTWIGRLDDPRTVPAGWAATPRPQRVRGQTDMVIYELHVRDFSIGDATVPPADRGRYTGFTHAGSDGMRHLKAMSAAGLTDVHLLPAFDLATVPERGCTTPDARELAALAARDPATPEIQRRVMAATAGDCFNWGYDPWHFTAPEGSFATDADDPAVRLREFRAMVQALHRAGLRVGMDVVYNHTTASGQHAKSVLDRIVPGYYQRLDGEGRVATSTCCDNTATEHRMMARLMIDSAVVWARDHRIDSFRFDLMGHQPREAMERLQRAVDAAAGQRIHLIGEGWNFGEIANGSRFVQASQQSLNGSGIGSFSDRGRDAARGGGCCDDAAGTLSRQGWLNGLHHDPNPHAPPSGPATREALMRAADLLRLGLAGTLRGYTFTTFDGQQRRGDAIDYAGHPAGFASQPGEVVNYVENHDNQTLFDIQALKLPPTTSPEDRARVQVLGLALTAFSQGVAYYHAGVELLRSKSGDRNSYDSGDWFNRIDWTLQDNGWAAGLPPERENAGFWPALRERLADPAIKPAPALIRFTRDAHLDLLRIRASSTAFRLGSADEVQRRLTMLGTGPEQVPTLLAAHLDARGLTGGGFGEIAFALNTGREAATVALPAPKGGGIWRLHPVHMAPGAADKRPVQQSRWDAAGGRLTVPPRTALVYVAD